MNQFFKIGFIGQGFVGGNLADNYQHRGYQDIMVRYDNSKYAGNKMAIKECDLVFVAVPTPSTPKGFDASVIYDVIPLTAPGSTVVIKSTVPPDVVRKLQEFFVDRTIMLCPEFLTEVTAKFDTDFPERNMVGVSDVNSQELRDKAELVIKTLPPAPYNKVCSYEDASLAKYAGNCFFYVKNMFFNILYDLANAYGTDWNTLHDMIVHDSRIHPVHTDPVHKGGRGAGGHCLIKDFAALKDMVKEYMPDDKNANAIMKANEDKNIELLKLTKKDLDLLEGVYGKVDHKSFTQIWDIIKDYGRPNI